MIRPQQPSALTAVIRDICGRQTVRRSVPSWWERWHAPSGAARCSERLFSRRCLRVVRVVDDSVRGARHHESAPMICVTLDYDNGGPRYPRRPFRKGVSSCLRKSPFDDGSERSAPVILVAIVPLESHAVKPAMRNDVRVRLLLGSSGCSSPRVGISRCCIPCCKTPNPCALAPRSLRFSREQ
jgi:hypothetical protein